jgi:hypothetical protein
MHAILAPFLISHLPALCFLLHSRNHTQLRHLPNNLLNRLISIDKAIPPQLPTPIHIYAPRPRRQDLRVQQPKVLLYVVERALLQIEFVPDLFPRLQDGWLRGPGLEGECVAYSAFGAETVGR